MSDDPHSDDPVTTFLEGSCHDHLLAVDSWLDGAVYLSLWNPVTSRQWGRWHWAWESLRGRWNGNTEVVLSFQDVRRLRDALISHITRVRQEEAINVYAP